VSALPSGSCIGKDDHRASAARGIAICAPAKLNLFLHVGETRPDNYHAVESLVVFAEVGDRMEFFPADDLSLKTTGPFARYLPGTGDNLVLKAARALKQAIPDGFNGGAAITLEKNLPVAAGIGGGSADAAACLRSLNVLWDLRCGEEMLMQIAAALGSDVPACVLSRPCWMEGRGEHVTRTSALPPLALVLVNPGVMVPTASVFAELNARAGLGRMEPPPDTIESLWDVVAYLDDSENDLEAPACRLQPAIADALVALDIEPGCVLAQMSGSGATCFGLFDGRHLALGAAERIAHEHPDWWVRATRIAGLDIGAPHWMLANSE
jgi:4-diphosphocytidyl-2-C-methyl-D-erythritol kinase